VISDVLNFAVYYCTLLFTVKISISITIIVYCKDTSSITVTLTVTKAIVINYLLSGYLAP